MKGRKILAIVLILTLCTSLLFGCSGEKNTQATTEKPKVDSSEETKDKTEKNETEKENTKLAQMEEALTNQLNPMPELNKGEKIGVLIISLTNPFWANMKSCYEEAGKELGIDVEVMAAPSEGDTTSQLETLDSMAVKDYNAIVFSPIDGNNLIPGIIRANQAGIPVINLGPGVNKEALKKQEGHLDGVITVDFENQGKMVAEDMLKNMPDGGKVAIIQGIPGAGQSEGRTKGAKETFEATEGVELVSIQPGNWDRNTAYNIATDLIQANPDLKGIFCCNDVMALAAVEALETAGKRDGIIIYGVDFTKEAQEAIKEGRLDGSITYSPKIYTKAALLLALKLSQGQEIKEPVYSPLIVVNRDNVNEFDGWK
ncbi:sugar ABC transporter substrate-binding protein [Maledivibacter halophilus]|uniref:D-allose transport system substrate-binding protein n=1 Tax=Maledivibacter halophilus TaxID=36842 RepID=A0A1T5MNJ6_9FIRM|nr:substrate-binding domain-containing protein [Maledivibacter halophilus]SKC89781.1 D-allose transport system substrate-binding protein [Maledivibacter halophilus]